MRISGILLSSLTLFALGQAHADVFKVQVIDSVTGRGVPLVELLPPSGTSLFTDSNGIIAVDDPALLNRTLQLGFRSYGYSAWNGSVQTTSGGEQQISLARFNRAERLYRLTGKGIYEDSVQVGASVPITFPLLNAQVAGQDSAQTAVYKNKIYWFWGDTIYDDGGFNFRTSGATSQLPGQGGLDPSLGVNLNYFVAPGNRAKQIFPINETGLVWVDGLFTAVNGGQERLLTHYSRIVPQPGDQFHVEEHGLALFNDSNQTFQRFQTYAANAPVVPRGHAFRHTVGGEEYIYFAEDYPNVRVKADWAHVTDLAQWEAFTPLLEGSRFNSANPPLGDRRQRRPPLRLEEKRRSLHRRHARRPRAAWPPGARQVPVPNGGPRDRSRHQAPSGQRPLERLPPQLDHDRHGGVWRQLPGRSVVLRGADPRRPLGGRGEGRHARSRHEQRLHVLQPHVAPFLRSAGRPLHLLRGHVRQHVLRQLGADAALRLQPDDVPARPRDNSAADAAARRL